MKCDCCPVSVGICLGETVPRLCILAKTRDDYRRQLVHLAQANTTNSPPLSLHILLEAVSQCPYRGDVLPPVLQPECGCSELTECRAGRGAYAGRVTMSDCLACMRRNLKDSAALRYACP